MFSSYRFWDNILILLWFSLILHCLYISFVQTDGSWFHHQREWVLLMVSISYPCPNLNTLILVTHWGRDKMAAISQTTLSNAFSWMMMLEFRLKFHWSLSIRVPWTIFQHWFRWWLGADQVTSHYLNQWWLNHRRIYASLGLNELFNSLWGSDIIWQHKSGSTLAQEMDCCLTAPSPLKNSAWCSSWAFHWNGL